MKMTVLLMIDSNRQSNVEVEAHGEDVVSIIIEAATIQEAKELLPQGEAAALEAMRTWTPMPKEPEVPKKEQEEHYKLSPITKEKAAKQMEEYEATTNGKRFKRSLELAADFRRKKESENAELYILQLLYLCNMSIVKNEYDAILASYDLGFRKGYKAAKKQIKEKH